MKLFSDAFKTIRKRSKILVLLIAILYFAFFSFGFLGGVFVDKLPVGQKENFKWQINQTFAFLNPIRDLIKNNQFPLLALVIFLNNLKSSLVVSISGLLIFPSFLFLLVNSTVLGFVVGLSSSAILLKYTAFELLTFILVFLIESVTVILASVEGFYLGISFLFPKRMYKRKMNRSQALRLTLSDTWKVYKMLILFLLIAAIIETMTIYSLKLHSVALVGT